MVCVQLKSGAGGSVQQNAGREGSAALAFPGILRNLQGICGVLFTDKGSCGSASQVLITACP